MLAAGGQTGKAEGRKFGRCKPIGPDVHHLAPVIAGSGYGLNVGTDPGSAWGTLPWGCRAGGRRRRFGR